MNAQAMQSEALPSSTRYEVRVDEGRLEALLSCQSTWGEYYEVQGKLSDGILRLISVLTGGRLIKPWLVGLMVNLRGESFAARRQA